VREKESMVGRTCGTGRFQAESERERELQMMTVVNQHMKEKSQAQEEVNQTELGTRLKKKY